MTGILAEATTEYGISTTDVSTSVKDSKLPVLASTVDTVSFLLKSGPIYLIYP